MIWVEKEVDALAPRGPVLGKRLRNRVTSEPSLEMVRWGRRNELELIMITRSKRLKSSEPLDILPSGQYLKFESLEDPGECLLFSRNGTVYRVRKQDLKDAIEEGYVKT